MKRLAALLFLLIATAATPAAAQNSTCPTAPIGTSNNQCASTAFVQNQITVGGPITVGTTPIIGGTPGRIPFDSSGVFGELPVTGTAGNVVLSVSPSLTGSPTAPTQSANDNTTKIATDAFVQAQFIANSVRVKLPTGTTNFYANSSSTGCTGGVPCLDTNDGLTTGTAKKTILGALYGVLNGYDFTCGVAAQTTAQINLLSSEVNAGQPIHFGPHDYAGACAGGSVVIDLGGFNLEYDSGSGNGPIAGFFGPIFSIQHGTIINTLGPCISLTEHGSIRVNAGGGGFVFNNCASSVSLDTDATITFNTAPTINTSGTVTAFVIAGGNSTVKFSGGAITVVNPVTYSAAMFIAKSGANIDMQSTTWTGGGNVTGAAYDILDGGSITNGAASIPGSTGTTESGGTADSAAVAISAGGTGATTASAARTALGLGSGLSVTKTVRASGGGSDCTLIFTNGILTGGSC